MILIILQSSVEVARCTFIKANNEKQSNIFPTFTIHTIFQGNQIADLIKFFTDEFQLINTENDKTGLLRANGDGEVYNK